MSTTITYKGDTLTTVENNTKVLKTAGKYMEGDVTLTDVSRAAPTIQSLSITPSESAQTFNASGVDGYKPVSVSAISSTYVGSGIARKSSTDLTVSGATISAPAGYYAEAASKTVSTTTLPTSLQIAPTAGYTKILTIDRQTSAKYINIKAGYNSTSSYYEIAKVPDGSTTGPTSLSASSATITTGTNTITLTKTDVTTTPTVSAGYVSSATASTATVALTASITVNPTPTVSEATVTIPAGYYTAQTTKSVASGTAGTPTATKGTVSNHAVSVTPSVTNTTGYITGSTKTGTAVSVAASELVSGSQTVTKNNTYDVTNLAQMVVNVAGGFEYEAGSFTPTSNVASRSVNFSKTHTKPPAIAMCFDVSQTAPTQDRTGLWICGDATEIVRTKIGPNWYESWSANVSGFLILWQAFVYGTYDGVRGAKRWATGLPYGNADTSQTSESGTRYYMNETRLNIAKYSWGSDCNAVLEANHKYVWLAIWVPDDWTQPT